jgi:hypothetical protein
MEDSKILQLTHYLARGWALVPLHDVTSGSCSCGAGLSCESAGKHPRGGAGWQRPENLVITEVQLLAALSRWPSCNWGLATGLISGVWALDLDPKNVVDWPAVNALLATLPPTWTQRTGSGGQHWVFALPDDFIPNNSSKRLPAGLDVRGARAGEVSGGQIVLAPSVSGVGAYEVLHGGAVLAGSATLLDLVRPAPPRERGTGRTTLGPEVSRDSTKTQAYVIAGINGALDDLRATASGRNGRAFAVGCRVLELANTGLVDREIVHSAWWAAAAAHPDPSVTVPDRELLSVWASAERTVGDRPADLSGVGGPSGWSNIGGEGIRPFAVPGAAPSLGQAGSGSGGGPPADREVLEQVFEHPDAHGLTLPEEFWNARPVLMHIRQAAHARTVSGDVAFYSVLTRCSALWPETVRLDTGVKAPASANLFAAITGPSGAGKSSGVTVAQRLLVRPPWLDEDGYADDSPLGSGEGVAEVFMGTKIVPVRDENGAVVVAKDGSAKTEKVRTKVRSNALLHADEGEVLNRMLQRSGATIGETLRRAWSGGTIGQSNGRTETTRIIKSGTYSLGMLIGFQRETAEPMLADSAAGTPQRFLWAWAIDPSIPDDVPPDPGPLMGIWRASNGSPGEGWKPWLAGGATTPEPDLRSVTFAPEIRAELRTLHLGLSRGTLTLAELDAHMPVTLVKVAALLAALEGRRDVTVEDWRLALIVWHTSCGVRDHLVAYGRSVRGKATAAKRAAHADDEAAAEVARHVVRDAVEQRRIARIAERIARLVGEAGADGIPVGALRAKIAQRDRDVFVEALEATLRVVVKNVDGVDRAFPL